jgi:alkylated DNA repair dioxygenase AlkB
LGPNPKWLDQIWIQSINTVKKFILNLKHLEEFDNGYDHVLINHYEVGDGCNPHTDDLKFWTGWVLGVSFGSGCTMNLISNYGKSISIYLPANSVYLLTGPARYVYKHGITFDSTDNVYGNKIYRTKRISLTFRSISEDYLDLESRQI